MNRGLDVDLHTGLAMEEALHCYATNKMLLTRIASLTVLPYTVHRLP